MTDIGTRGGWRALTITGQASGRGSVPLRPMTIGDLLDAPFGLLRRHLREMVLLVAIAVIPAQIATSYLQRGMFSGGLGGFLQDPEGFMFSMQADQGETVAVWFVTGANYLLLMPFAIGLVSRLVISSVLGEGVTAGEVLRATMRRAPVLLGAWLLVLAAVVLPIALAAGMIALGGAAAIAGGVLILPLMLLSVALAALLAASPTVAVVEPVGPVGALRRSVRLVRPRAAAVWWTLVLATFIAGLVQAAVAAVPGLFAFGLQHEASWLLVAIGSVGSQLLVTPYVIIVAALVYVDGCVRREALDIRILAGG